MTTHKDCPQCAASTRFLEAMQQELASRARENYARDGRGVLMVEIPVLPPGTQAVVQTDTLWVPLAEVKRTTQGHADAHIQEDAAVLVRMIETYDPAIQAVISCARGQHLITVKMRLDPPFVYDTAPGVH